MKSREKSMKERILEEALKLFAHSGYMGTSMNDIAARLGVTKAALYKHYTSKQEIFENIVEKMNELDKQRASKYEMPQGNMEEITQGYKSMPLDKIKQYAKVQFLHWTEDEFSACFRKMLILEQYRDEKMAELYQKYFVQGPFSYIQAIFEGFIKDKHKARQLALDFYGPIFMLYSIYDGVKEKQDVVDMVENHVEHFSHILEESL